MSRNASKRSGSLRTLTAGYQWTCPICRASRVTTYNADNEEQRSTYNRAKRALSAHLRSSAESGHGPKNAQPDEFDSVTLEMHIESVVE